MAYRRSTARRGTRSRSRSRGRATAPRRSYRSRSRSTARRSVGRVQTVRIVLEGHNPSTVQRPVGIGQMTAAPQRTRPQF